MDLHENDEKYFSFYKMYKSYIQGATMTQDKFGLTDDEYDDLVDLADSMLELANVVSSDHRNAVVSYYNRHWLFTYYRNIENLMEDSWTVQFSPINTMIVTVSNTESPQIESVIPILMINKETGEVLMLKEIVEEGDEDE